MTSLVDTPRQRTDGWVDEFMRYEAADEPVVRRDVLDALPAGASVSERLDALCDAVELRLYLEDQLWVRGYATAPRVAGERSPNPHLVDADEFLFSESTEVCALWGDNDEVLWAKGEMCLIVGGDGTGKTTLAQQLALASCGIGPGELLGYPVAEETEGKVLYLAADRPTQARRSLVRMVTPALRRQLKGRLVIHKGPLLQDLGDDPHALVRVAIEAGARRIFVDSLKDVVLDIAEDSGGTHFARAIQLAVQEGIDVCVLHHPRKKQQGVSQAGDIADVYGSRWVTAVAGSVLMIRGNPGDPLVELRHLKQPMEEVGPIKVLHDHAAGSSRVQGYVDLVSMVESTSSGVTAHDVACRLFETTSPSPSEIEKARRRVEKLVVAGRIGVVKGRRGGAATAYVSIV